MDRSGKQTQRKRNRSLQALRGIAFLGVFLAHEGMSFAWADLSVSVFFVLSGYLLTLRYAQRELPDTLRGRGVFAWRHIARIYPLHLITMALYAILRLIIQSTAGLTGGDIAEVLGLMALDTVLLQSWVPHHLINVSLNGVAWFLSSMLFLYFVFPPLIRRLRPGGKAAWGALMLGIPAAQILTCVPLILAHAGFYVYSWYSYCFPLFRLGDFAAGCCLGLFVLEGRGKTKRKKGLSPGYTALELLLLAVTVGEKILRHREHTSPVIEACFNNTSLNIWLALAWVWLFSRHRGALTRLLSFPFMVWVGDISPYAYLIHYLLTQYALQIRALFGCHPEGWAQAAVILAELALSLLLSAAWRRMARLRAQLRAVAG